LYYRFEDLHVAGAATKISSQTGADIFLGWLGISLKQIDGSEHHSGSADAALSATMIDKRLLHGMKPVVAGNAFDRSYLSTAHLHNWNQATVNDLTVDDHRARATLTLATTFLGSSQLQLVAQDVEQPRHRKHLDLPRLTVNLKLDCVFRGH
jgi:hypothetical protein